MAKRKNDKGDAEHWNDFFHETVKGESDRASVIIAGAMLEQALETMLRSHLVPVASENDSLFDGAYAPIATFSAKIDVAYRLGLISSVFAKALHLIRRIRNDFAHNVTGCSFADAAVRSRVFELGRSLGVVESAASIRRHYPAGPSGDFLITVSWMLWMLWQSAKSVQPIRPEPDFRPPAERNNEEPADEGEGEAH